MGFLASAFSPLKKTGASNWESNISSFLRMYSSFFSILAGFSAAAAAGSFLLEMMVVLFRPRGASASRFFREDLDESSYWSL